MHSPGKLAGPKSRLKGIGLLISVICLGTAGVLYHQSLRASEETDAYLSASRTTSPSPYQDSNGIQTRRVLDVHAQLSREEDASPKWQQTAEASFQKGLQRRHQALQQLINAPFNPWDISRGVYIWVSPTYNSPCSIPCSLQLVIRAFRGAESTSTHCSVTGLVQSRFCMPYYGENW